MVNIGRCIRKSFNWLPLPAPLFPLPSFVRSALKATLPWHLSAVFILYFIMWPFCTLWLSRYNFLSCSQFYGWLFCVASAVMDCFHRKGKGDCGSVFEPTIWRSKAFRRTKVFLFFFYTWRSRWLFGQCLCKLWDTHCPIQQNNLEFETTNTVHGPGSGQVEGDPALEEED